MAALDRYVSVNITRNTQAIQVASFSIPLLLGSHAAWPERARTYSSIDAIGADFAVTSKIYKMAQTLYSQQLVSGTVVIGRREADYSAAVASAPVGTAEVYSISVNGEVVATYTAADTGTPLADVINGLVAAAAGVDISVVDASAGTFNVTAAVAGSIVTSTANVALTPVVSNESYSEAILAVNDLNSSWFALAIDSRADQDILDAAATIEALKKVFFTASASADVANQSIETDLASQLKALGYEGTSLMYSPDAATEYPDVAWLWPLNSVVGSTTWAFKQLNGVSATNHSENVITALDAKNVNFYRTVAGVNITDSGKMVGGSWVDETVGTRWLTARIQEAVFGLLVRTKKVPYTSAGVTMVEAQIRSVLNQAITNGLISPAPAYTVTSPNVLTASINDKANRILGDFSFVATLQGAVHKVVIYGSLEY